MLTLYSRLLKHDAQALLKQCPTNAQYVTHEKSTYLSIHSHLRNARRGGSKK